MLGTYYAFNLLLVGCKENVLKDDKGNASGAWYNLTFMSEIDDCITFTCGERVAKKLQKGKSYDLNLNYVYEKGTWKLRLVDAVLSSGFSPNFENFEVPGTDKGAKK